MPSRSRVPARAAAPHIPPRLRDLLTSQEACAYARISMTTLRDYVRDGRLHAYKLGPKSLRFDPADLDKLLSA
jgi:excisionase family DNA binding protein